jgi:hypothetical protein
MVTVPKGSNEKVYTLYRFYNADRQLLYIGVTTRFPTTRWDGHRETKPWWSDVVTASLEHFDTKEEMLATEILAIHIEQPLHNVRHANHPHVEEKHSTVTFLRYTDESEGMTDFWKSQEEEIADYRRVLLSDGTEIWDISDPKWVHIKKGEWREISILEANYLRDRLSADMAYHFEEGSAPKLEDDGELQAFLGAIGKAA